MSETAEAQISADDWASAMAEQAPAPAAANGSDEEPKLGSTLKRLLWGAGNRGGR